MKQSLLLMMWLSICSCASAPPIRPQYELGSINSTNQVIVFTQVPHREDFPDYDVRLNDPILNGSVCFNPESWEAFEAYIIRLEDFVEAKQKYGF